MTIDSAYFPETYTLSAADFNYSFEFESVGADTVVVRLTGLDENGDPVTLFPLGQAIALGGVAPIYARGVVTFSDIAEVGGLTTIDITRKTPITQELDLVPLQPTPSESVEFGLDKLTLILQEIDGSKCDCPWGGTIDDPNPSTPEPEEAIPGCLQWGLSETSAAAVDWWVSPITSTVGNATGHMNRDKLAAIKNDAVYVYVNDSIIYSTETFNSVMSSQTEAEFMYIDNEWRTREGSQGTSGFSGQAYNNDTGEPRNFSMTAWKFIGSRLYSCWFQNDSKNSFIQAQGVGVVSSGFTTNARTASPSPAQIDSLQSGYLAVPYLPASFRKTFTETPFGGSLAYIGQVFEILPGDPYPEVHALAQGGDTEDAATALSKGNGAPERLELINDNYLWWGPWGPGNGSTQSNRYGIVPTSVGKGGTFTFNAAWLGPPDGYESYAWWAQDAPLYQPNSVEQIPSGGNYPDSFRQRPAKFFLQEGTDQMFCGTISKRYGYLYSNLTNSAEQDYSGEFEFAARAVFDVYPVNEKGAFISVEVLNTNLRNARMKISPTGQAGTFSEPVSFTLPTAVNINAQQVQIDYSASQALFLITYLGSDNRIHIVTVEDKFICTLFEEIP